jgi:serine/threonine protein kinase/tetratricopeptide (TPR) repeat protein
MNEREIFIGALQRESSAERAAYLAQACGGNADLLHGVQALLDVHERAGGFLAAPPPSPVATSTESAVSEGPGTVIGPYRLLEQIGEGGMGLVFVAEQQQPVRRKVALKVIKPGMDTRAVVARFEAERQALALMDHPNIARVFDGGATASGRPYFVMELVRGVPVTEFCDQDRLGIRERLGLFVDVCSAVQHAHQKGVIHRDIKPSNVLVTRHDDRAVVKVIDFGIAKATGQLLTDKTVYTAFAQMVGTPLYMSPEQAQLSGLDIDTRSDIYSLGVLLYELLTGTTPFDDEMLRTAGFDEIRRIIREEEPARPSTRISTLGQTAATVSANRRSDPQKLSRLVRGELDWIVMKALEKDRNRRYESTSAFAADVQRYLADEPVAACPPSAGYRLRKFVRRNRVPVVAAAAVFLALAAGVIGTTLGLVQAHQQETMALGAAEEEKKARIAEADQRLRTAEALKEVTRAGTQRRTALNTMTDEVIEKLLARQTTLDAEERAFLGKVLGFYEVFASERGDTPEARVVAADGQFRVAQVRALLGEKTEAAAGLREAVRLWEKLAADSPADADHRANWARSCLYLGNLLTDLGKLSEAATFYRQAMAVQEQLVADWPAVPAYRQNVAMSHHNLGHLLATQGKRPEAVTEYRQAIAMQTKLAEELPAAAMTRRDLARSHSNLAVVLTQLGQGADADAAFARALAMQEKLADEFPTVPAYRLELAATRGVLANRLSDLGKHVEAEAEVRRSLAIYRRLAADYPALPRYRQHLASGHNDLGIQLAIQGKYPEADAEFGQALAIGEKLTAEFPAVPTYRTELAGNCVNYGKLRRGQKRGTPEELALYTRAIALLEANRTQEPGTAMERLFLRNAYTNRADALGYLQRYPEAVADQDRAIELDEGPLRPRLRVERAVWLVQAGEHAKAAAEAEAVAGLPDIPPEGFVGCARVLCFCADRAKDDAALRKQYADRALAVLTKAVAAGYANAPYLKTNPDWAVLQPRDDFKHLVSDLEKRSPPAREE